MSVLSKIFQPSGDIEEVCILMCKLLGLRYTSVWLSRSLKDSPNYPSMLSIYDVFRDYGVKTEAYKCDVKKLENVSWPFIVQVENTGNEKGKRFAIVVNATNGIVTWKNPYSGKWENIRFDSFADFFTGYVMFFEADKDSGERDYRRHLHEEIAEYVTKAAMLFILPVLFVVAVLWYFLTDGPCSVSPCFYGCLLLVGSCIGGLLLAHEYNDYSPLVRHFCGSSGNKISCDAVLSSNGSTFCSIPWTMIGGGYFVGALSALSLSCFDTGVMSLLTWIHVPTLPYIGYSIYYQKRVVGQWCPLCLTVLAVIAAMFVTAFIGGNFSEWHEITIRSILCVVCCMCLAWSCFLLVWKYGVNLRKTDYVEHSFKLIKYNSEVFKTLLHKEKMVNIPTDDYGIILGNPNGSIHIIVVINPYCSHCATALKILFEILEIRRNIFLQIVFTIRSDFYGYNDTPIDLFLSLAKRDSDIIEAINDWFSMPTKNLALYMEKHPVKSWRSIENDKNAKRMAEFCEVMDITETPTFFINGFQLPSCYNIGDFKFLF